MSDFVTVDEVGDVTDLPGSLGPTASPAGTDTPSPRTPPFAGDKEKLPPAEVGAAQSNLPAVEVPVAGTPCCVNLFLFGFKSYCCFSIVSHSCFEIQNLEEPAGT